MTSSTGCFSTRTVTSDASLLPIGGAMFFPSNPTAEVLLYLSVSFSANEYANGLPGLTVTLPADITTAGRQFYVAANRSGGAALSWMPAVEGPVSASGSTLTFGSGGGASTFDAGEIDYFAVYSVAD
jgi:hypothetical protein